MRGRFISRGVVRGPCGASFSKCSRRCPDRHTLTQTMHACKTVPAGIEVALQNTTAESRALLSPARPRTIPRSKTRGMGAGRKLRVLRRENRCVQGWPAAFGVPGPAGLRRDLLMRLPVVPCIVQVGRQGLQEEQPRQRVEEALRRSVARQGHRAGEDVRQ